jgi:hypothetical protein
MHRQAGRAPPGEHASVDGRVPGGGPVCGPTRSRPLASVIPPLPYNSFMTRQTVSRVAPIRSAIS